MGREGLMGAVGNKGMGWFVGFLVAGGGLELLVLGGGSWWSWLCPSLPRDSLEWSRSSAFVG